jgi:hypothetical protein
MEEGFPPPTLTKGKYIQMRNSKIIVVTFLLISLNLSAQNKFSMNLRSGLMYFTLDEMSRESLRGYNAFTGPSWTNEISASVTLFRKNKFSD